MKPIKLTEKNSGRLRSALDDSIKRTFTLQELMRFGKEAEGKLESMGVLKKNRPGSGVRIPYGDCVPNSYRWSAEEQVLTLLRRPTGWFLVGVARGTVPMRPYGKGGYSRHYTISPASLKDLMKHLGISLEKTSTAIQGG